MGPVLGAMPHPPHRNVTHWNAGHSSCRDLPSPPNRRRGRLRLGVAPGFSRGLVDHCTVPRLGLAAGGRKRRAPSNARARARVIVCVCVCVCGGGACVRVCARCVLLLCVCRCARADPFFLHAPATAFPSVEPGRTMEGRIRRFLPATSAHHRCRRLSPPPPSPLRRAAIVAAPYSR